MSENPWICSRCGQKNSAWAKQCGRCEDHLREPLPAEEQLLPCPFCGGRARMGLGKTWHDSLHGDEHQDTQIWCSMGNGVNYEGAHARARGRDRAQAINKWNARAASEPRAVHEREPPHCPTCECGEAKQDILHDVAGTDFCEDCPPVNYPTDKTRCADCPRRAAATKEGSR